MLSAFLVALKDRPTDGDQALEDPAPSSHPRRGPLQGNTLRCRACAVGGADDCASLKRRSSGYGSTIHVEDTITGERVSRKPSKRKINQEHPVSSVSCDRTS